MRIQIASTNLADISTVLELRWLLYILARVCSKFNLFGVSVVRWQWATGDRKVSVRIAS
jgi:hypothetical protein